MCNYCEQEADTNLIKWHPKFAHINNIKDLNKMKNDVLVKGMNFLGKAYDIKFTFNRLKHPTTEKSKFSVQRIKKFRTDNGREF